MHELESADLELQKRTSELTLRFQSAPAAERESLAKELRTVVERHFDVRQQKRELQVKRLADELEQLRQSIERRNQARPQIIERRMSELIGADRELAF